MFYNYLFHAMASREKVPDMPLSVARFLCSC